MNVATSFAVALVVLLLVRARRSARRPPVSHRSAGDPAAGRPADDLSDRAGDRADDLGCRAAGGGGRSAGAPRPGHPRRCRPRRRSRFRRDRHAASAGRRGSLARGGGVRHRDRPQPVRPTDVARLDPAGAVRRLWRPGPRGSGVRWGALGVRRGSGDDTGGRLRRPAEDRTADDRQLHTGLLAAGTGRPGTGGCRRAAAGRHVRYVHRRDHGGDDGGHRGGRHGRTRPVVVRHRPTVRSRPGGLIQAEPGRGSRPGSAWCPVRPAPWPSAGRTRAG